MITITLTKQEAEIVLSRLVKGQISIDVPLDLSDQHISVKIEQETTQTIDPYLYQKRLKHPHDIASDWRPFCMGIKDVSEKIGMIKIVRCLTTMGLAEAKRFVEENMPRTHQGS